MVFVQVYRVTERGHRYYTVHIRISYTPQSRILIQVQYIAFQTSDVNVRNGTGQGKVGKMLNSKATTESTKSTDDRRRPEWAPRAFTGVGYCSGATEKSYSEPPASSRMSRHAMSMKTNGETISSSRTLRSLTDRLDSDAVSERL